MKTQTKFIILTTLQAVQDIIETERLTAEDKHKIINRLEQFKQSVKRL